MPTPQKKDALRMTDSMRGRTDPLTSGVKLKFTVEQATKAQKGSRGIDLLFL